MVSTVGENANANELHCCAEPLAVGLTAYDEFDVASAFDGLVHTDPGGFGMAVERIQPVDADPDCGEVCVYVALRSLPKTP